MKGAWALIAIGALLIVEGTVRIGFGLSSGGVIMTLGGFLTGWILGGFLLYRGIKRRKQFLGVKNGTINKGT